ncbi:MAG: class I SAM-dependent methyltransferase [Planctomycetota bacterium]|jgi:ubiquinone/menaquinone biosynthesis C-methylase UbiE|nr:class I SAM-dependent methyltransferase [Planctomycetota bacterium]MDP6504426.1 class I SAM-dependent methyltransferase [Planctomycetota bacterium]
MSGESMPGAEVWQDEGLVKRFLEGVRGGIPLLSVQLRMIRRMLRRIDFPVVQFLDLGCGDGILSATVLEEFPDARGVLLDFSQAMLDAAHERFEEWGRELTFLKSDFSDPGWTADAGEHAPFDAVVSGFSIHHQPDEIKRQIYEQVLSLLRPGGIFLNNEHVLSPTQWIENASDECFVDSLYLLHLKKGTGKSKEQVLHEFVHRPDKEANILTRVEKQCDWLREIGYEDVDCYFKIFELAVFGGRRPK